MFSKHYSRLQTIILGWLISTALFVFPAFAGPQQSAEKSTGARPDRDLLEEAADYQLSMDRIRRIAITAKELSDHWTSNPDIPFTLKIKGHSGSMSITELAKVIDEAYPQAAAIVKKNGFSTREYLVATATLSFCSIGVQAKKSGMKAPPNKVPGKIAQANIELLEKNWDEIQRLLASMSKPSSKN